MNQSKLKTPVLFMVFNRLDPAKKVFGEIKKARPKQLFIASDGPRNDEEKKIVESVRKYVLDNIDWECKVKTLFRKKNLGCKYAVAGAIDWFFENVKQGIILEDDCLPDQSFFPFCQEMLEKYRDDDEISQVCGTNLKNLGNFDEIEFKNHLKFFERSFRRYHYNLVKQGTCNTWDYQWNILRDKNGMLNITPEKNLIHNIGFGADATHTKKELKIGRGRQSITFPLRHPCDIKINKKYERDYYWKIITPVSIRSSVKCLINFFR
jgi:hypothetical protein